MRRLRYCFAHNSMWDHTYDRCEAWLLENAYADAEVMGDCDCHYAEIRIAR